MELLESLFRFCTSALALIAAASAYKAHEDLNEVDDRIDRLSKELDEVKRRGEIGADRDERE